MALKAVYYVRGMEPVFFVNDEEYQLGKELKKWGILKRQPEEVNIMTYRMEKPLRWMYPPVISSKRQALLQLEKLLGRKEV